MFSLKQKLIKSIFSSKNVKKAEKVISKFFLYNIIPFGADDSGSYYQAMINRITKTDPKTLQDIRLAINIWRK